MQKIYNLHEVLLYLSIIFISYGFVPYDCHKTNYNFTISKYLYKRIYKRNGFNLESLQYFSGHQNVHGNFYIFKVDKYTVWMFLIHKFV